MGAQLSPQEALFVEGRFDELISVGRAPDFGKQFCMSGKEWEALGTACEGLSFVALRGASEMLERCDASSFAYPPVACIVHFLAAREGAIPLDAARERWSAVLAEGDQMCASGTWVHQQLYSHLAAVKNFLAAYENNFGDEIETSIEEIDGLLVAASQARPVQALILGIMRALLFLRLLQCNSPLRANDAAAMSVGSLLSATAALHFEVQVVKRLVRTISAEDMQMQLQLMARGLHRNTLQLQSSTGQQISTSPLTWQRVSERFVGQSHVIDELSQFYLFRERGLASPNKPAVMVFFGPSGHGKTQLAKLVAQVLHSSSSDCEAEGKLMIIHMPSFCTRDSIYSMVDPPAAHVGEGILLSAVRKCENMIVVLDEFEKSTSDAVQNIWLSAFQRDGMLRSLKEASRSVSTVKLTFVLTCNTCDSLIQRQESSYLASDEGERKAYRQSWTSSCTDELRRQFGEPFVNRVDRFLPFTPYDMEEKREFVTRQLASIATQQERHYRRLLFTPALVHYLATRITNFHGAIVEEILRSCLLVATNSEGTRELPVTVLLHVERRLEGEEIVLYTEAQLKELSGGPDLLTKLREETASKQKPESSSPPTVEQKATAHVDPIAAPLKKKEAEQSSSVKTVPPAAKHQQVSSIREDAAAPTKKNAEAAAEGRGNQERNLVMEMDLHKELETAREKQLTVELAATKEKLLEAEMTIALLRETLKSMEVLLGIMLATVITLLLFLSLFVSLSTIFTIVCIMLGTTFLLCKNMFMVITAAVRGLYRLVGPVPFIIGSILALWFLWSRAQWILFLAPPCTMQQAQPVGG